MAKATDIVDSLNDAAGHGDPVSVGAINDELGHRGTGALIAVPAAVELTPIGGIPGVPTAIAVMVGVFAVQIIMGRQDMWLPNFLEKRTIHADKLRAAAGKLRPATEWMDRHFGRRLSWFSSKPGIKLAAVAILLLCFTIPPLELVPFASSIPTGTMLLFGVGMLVRDGLVMLLGWIAFAAAAVGIWFIIPF